MPVRHILEGVVVIHETIHELHRKKLDGVLLKLDFEKAYDKVKCDFLQQPLRMKGFDPKWCKWIHKFIICGSVGIRVHEISDIISKQGRGYDKETIYITYSI
jgi:hypothetical protein